MDGLTISGGDRLLNAGETSGSRASTLSRQELGSAEGSAKSFSETLKDAVNHVNTLQKSADTAMQQVATGENKNVAEVMIQTEQADIALKLMMQVRNKIIEAYQEVMRMQV
jgi:flagellar hook-basal body complex protein FliE